MTKPRTTREENIRITGPAPPAQQRPEQRRTLRHPQVVLRPALAQTSHAPAAREDDRVGGLQFDVRCVEKRAQRAGASLLSAGGSATWARSDAICRYQPSDLDIRSLCSSVGNSVSLSPCLIQSSSPSSSFEQRSACTRNTALCNRRMHCSLLSKPSAATHMSRYTLATLLRRNSLPRAGSQYIHMHIPRVPAPPTRSHERGMSSPRRTCPAANLVHSPRTRSHTSNRALGK